MNSPTPLTPAPELREALAKWLSNYWEKARGHVDDLVNWHDYDEDDRKAFLRDADQASALLATPQPQPPSGTALDLEAIEKRLEGPDYVGKARALCEPLIAEVKRLRATQPSGEAPGA